MVTIALILTFIEGLCLLQLVAPKITLLEKIGLSFLCGIFLNTLALTVLDLFAIPLIPVFLFGVLIITLIMLIFFIIKRDGIKPFSLNIQRRDLIVKLSSINLVWLIFAVAVIIVAYMNFQKCIYFPTFDRDSLAGFDTIGYIIGQEKTIRNLSIFDPTYNPSIYGAGSYISYAPFVQLAYGFVYILGAETSKIIPALMFASFIVVFYAVLTTKIKKTGAIIITFMMIITPEMLSFSSLSATNVMHAIYASLGVIYGLSWFQNKEKGALYISAILLGANNWTRSEGIIFIIPLFLLYLIDSFRSHNYRDTSIWFFIAIVPFVFWTFYQKVFGLTSESIIITHPFWDGEKMRIIANHLVDIITDTDYYGWTFILFGICLILNLWFIVKKKDSIKTPFVIIVSLILYLVILYQIDYKWDSITNVLLYSFKRFVFCFVPIAWYYIATNYLGCKTFEKMDDLLSFKTAK